LAPHPMAIHTNPLPCARKRKVRPPKDPDKQAVLLGISVVGGLELLQRIAASEKALMQAIGDETAGYENREIINRAAEVSVLVWAAVQQSLQRAELPSLYGALQEYQAILLQANRSIMESDTVMLHTISRDLEESLPHFEGILKKISVLPSPRQSDPALGQGASLHMFQSARGVVISGGQFIQQLPDNGSREQSDKILWRLNCLLASVLF